MKYVDVGGFAGEMSVGENPHGAFQFVVVDYDDTCHPEFMAWFAAAISPRIVSPVQKMQIN